MYRSKTTLRVRYAETDQMGVVYHGNYFQYFEVGRVEAMRQLGFSYAALEAAGILMPVIDVQCKYIKPALYDELLTVTTELREWPRGYKINFHNELTNEAGELLAAAKIVLCFLSKKNNSPLLLPPVFADLLKPYFSHAGA